jgi:hypothetical protein
MGILARFRAGERHAEQISGTPHDIAIAADTAKARQKQCELPGYFFSPFKPEFGAGFGNIEN